MMWLASPASDRVPPTLEAFRKAHRCTHTHLAAFHVEPSFVEAVAGCVESYVRRISHVREAIYLNALDSKRKDQADWMYLYEDMLARHAGEGVRFMPPRNPKENQNAHRQEAAGRPRDAAGRPRDADGEPLVRFD